MEEQKELAKFLRENVPQFTIGSSLYWIDDIGNSREEKNAIKAIVLDSDWQWKAVNDNKDVFAIEPGKPSRLEDFLSFQDAVEFRKTLTYKFVIFDFVDEGNLTLKNPEQKIHFRCKGTLKGEDIIKKNVAEELIERFSLKNSVVVTRRSDVSDEIKIRNNVLVTLFDGDLIVDENGNYDNGVWNTYICLENGARELEDMFY